MTEKPAYPPLALKIERVVGYVPLGTKDLLNVLAHPDVIDLTRAFLAEQDQVQNPDPGASS